MANSTFNADYQLLLEVLRKHRDDAELTQVELAERLGTTQGFISKCERGSRRIDVVELVEIAEALNVPPLQLIGDFLKQRKPGLHPKIRRKRRSFKR